MLTENYITAYCGFKPQDFNARAPGWIADIRAIQDFFESRGVTFLYVLTPSKVAVYPDTIPKAYNCPSDLENQHEKLLSYRRQLDQAGVHTVDTATMTSNEAVNSPIALFARGGVHWNKLAAGRAAQQISVAINSLRGANTLTPFTLTWKRGRQPDIVDRDALDLLNLLWPDTKYDVPIVEYQARPDEVCHSTHVTEVAGSFIFRVDEALTAVACPPHIDLWWYWNLKHFQYPDSAHTPYPIDAEERRRSLLDKPDVVILEENESAIPRSTQGEALFDFVKSQTAGQYPPNIDGASR